MNVDVVHVVLGRAPPVGHRGAGAVGIPLALIPQDIVRPCIEGLLAYSGSLGGVGGHEVQGRARGVLVVAVRRTVAANVGPGILLQQGVFELLGLRTQGATGVSTTPRGATRGGSSAGGATTPGATATTSAATVGDGRDGRCLQVLVVVDVGIGSGGRDPEIIGVGDDRLVLVVVAIHRGGHQHPGGDSGLVGGSASRHHPGDYCGLICGLEDIGKLEPGELKAILVDEVIFHLPRFSIFNSNGFTLVISNMITKL